MEQTLVNIERTALALSPRERAQLAVTLLASLEETAESPEVIEAMWVEEADRRFRELRDGITEGIPAEEVFAELRSRRP
jgi:putative addiction module component (TIGR02574 family)